MAEFIKAMEVLDSWEGGYSNISSDPGGETYCGISRRHWPNWEGWNYLDSFKSHGPLPQNWRGDISLNQMVYNFYVKNFWNTQSFALINNQDIADKIFQHYVNLGDRAIKLSQAVIFYGFKNYNLFKEFDGKEIDGKLGGVTASKLNAKDANTFLERYIEILSSYYEELIQEHPQLKVNEHEWMLRAKTIGKRPA